MALLFVPTSENLARMRALLEAGVGVEAISLQLHCSIRTVERWVDRFQGGQENPEFLYDNRINNRGALKLTDVEVGRIQNVMQTNPFQHASKLPQELDLNVTAQTIRKTLKTRCHLQNYKAAKKTAQRPNDQNLGLAFANTYHNWNVDQWRQVCFMDEKVFSTYHDGRVGVWRPPNTRYQPEYVLPKHYSGHVTKYYWGWISGDGFGGLVQINRRMNAQLYTQILEEHFLPAARARYPNEVRIYVVEDNSPVYTAAVTRQWYQNHSDIIRLALLPRSPDLNVIENAWSEMVRDWRPEDAHNEQELQAAVRNSWRALHQHPEYFLALTNSMPRRLQRVINARGAPLNY